MRNKDNKKGFIAIISAILISVIIILVVLSSASSVYFGRGDTLISKSKKSTKYLAESCLENALLKLANDKSYSGNESISFLSYTCKIGTIINQGANKIIKSSASSSYSSTNLILTVASTTLKTMSFEEVPSF